jgi:hypothetical protein
VKGTGCLREWWKSWFKQYVAGRIIIPHQKCLTSSFLDLFICEVPWQSEIKFVERIKVAIGCNEDQELSWIIR